MMTVSDGIGAKHAAFYFKREHAKDYYLDGKTDGTWFGAGAAALGLSGSVSTEAFQRVLDGKHPTLDLQLVKVSSATNTRTAGWDVTFAAPKSVSICALIGRDDRILRAHEEAVRAGLSAIEPLVTGRVRDSKIGVLTGNAVVAQFEHITSRHLDPHLHTHNVFVNLTRREDGRWIALNSPTLFQAKRLGTAVYRSVLAERLLSMGYELRHGKNGAWEIASVSEEQIRHFSKSHEKLVAHLAKTGQSGAAAEKRAHRATKPRKQHVEREHLDEVWRNAGEEAGLTLTRRANDADTTAQTAAGEAGPAPSAEPVAQTQTPAPDGSAPATNGPESSTSESSSPPRRPRRGKNHLTRADLDEVWRQLGAGASLDVNEIVERSQSATPATGGSPKQRAHRAREAVDYAIQHVTERESVFRVEDIAEAALNRRSGYVQLEEVLEEIQRRVAAREIVPHRDRSDILTTRAVLDMEREMLRRLEAGYDAVTPLCEDPDLSEHGLSAEQAAVARLVLTTPDRIVGVQGVAGAGKTHALRAVLSEAQAAGMVVRGLAPTTRAVRELAKSGLESRTVASHLNVRGAALGRELWIVDEAGLLSAKGMAALLRHAEEAHARVVLVGDVRQHGAVEGGMPFRLLQSAGMMTAELSQIYRQKDNPELLEAVTAASKGDARQAITHLDRLDAIQEIEDWEERHDHMADDFAARPDGTLIVAPSNKERDDLNAKIRTRLQEMGKVADEGREVETLRSRDLTGVQRTVAAQYEVGDVICYRKDSRRYEIAKGTYATVVDRDVAANLLTVELPNGSRRTYSPARLSGVDVFERHRRTFTVGDRVQFRAVIKNPSIANGSIGTIVEISDDGRAKIRFEESPKEAREVEINLDTIRHIDYGWAVTSHSSQGATVDRALVAVRTANPRMLVNQAQVYVSISRARSEVTVYTDSRTDLPGAVAREAPKANALDLSLDMF